MLSSALPCATSSTLRLLTLASLLAFLAAAAPTVSAASHGDIPCPADPFADPRNDPCNGLRYIASNALTAVAFTLIVLSGLIQVYSMFRWGAKWMMCMVIGEFAFALGIGCRFGLTLQPDSKAIYIVEYLFVVLSPCAFIAADYILLGRLARHLHCEHHLFVPANRVMAIFLTSDVITFLIQAAGGGISIGANDAKGAKLGSNVFLAGLAIQLLSFLLFTCLFVVFVWRVRRFEREVWGMDGRRAWWRDWRALAVAVAFSCVGILIRSVYRTVELSQGFEGAIATNEGFFYGLDTLPLWIAIVVYCPFWPGRFIPPFSSVSAPAPMLVNDEEREGRESSGTVPVENEKEKEKGGEGSREGGVV